jgi:hypothetical protein
LDDTLCEHVESLFEYIDCHYHHGDGNYPLAHNPVTSHYVSGPVRFPVDLRLYRRYEEVTCWEEFVHKHFPKREIPTRKKEQAQLHKQVDPVLLQDTVGIWQKNLSLAFAAAGKTGSASSKRTANWKRIVLC